MLLQSIDYQTVTTTLPKTPPKVANRTKQSCSIKSYKSTTLFANFAQGYILLYPIDLSTMRSQAIGQLCTTLQTENLTSFPYNCPRGRKW